MNEIDAINEKLKEIDKLMCMILFRKELITTKLQLLEKKKKLTK